MVMMVIENTDYIFDNFETSGNNQATKQPT
jgi:hypothetical protein